MANASMRQTSQLAVEPVSYGVIAASPSWKRFTSFGLSLSPNLGVATATPRGQTSATAGWISREDSAFSIEDGVLSYDEVVYLLESAIAPAGAATTSGTTGKQRVYTIDQFAPTGFASYTVENGSFGTPQRVYRVLGGFVNEWGFTISSSDDQIGMTGSLLGKKANIQATPGSASPSAYQVAIPSQFTLGYATAGTYAGLGTALTNVANSFSVGFNISDRRALVRYLGAAGGEPSETVETVPGLTFDLTLADEVAPVDAFLSNARAGTKQFFRLKGTGPVIGAGPAVYTFQLDISCVLRDSPSVDETDGVQSVTFPYSASYDSVSGKIFEITTINALATL